MIPNHVPMAAVYLNTQATGSRDGRLSSRPVIAWEDDGTPMVCFDTRLRWASDHLAYPDTELLGIWQNGWTPSYDEMSTLLPKQEREEMLVAAQQLADGTWFAFRTVNGVQLASAATYDELEQALGRHHLHCTVEKVVPLEDQGTTCTEDYRRPVCLPFHMDDCPYV